MSLSLLTICRVQAHRNSVLVWCTDAVSKTCCVTVFDMLSLLSRLSFLKMRVHCGYCHCVVVLFRCIFVILWQLLIQELHLHYFVMMVALLRRRYWFLIWIRPRINFMYLRTHLALANAWHDALLFNNDLLLISSILIL